MVSLWCCGTYGREEMSRFGMVNSMNMQATIQQAFLNSFVVGKWQTNFIKILGIWRLTRSIDGKIHQILVMYN